jgi:hypothetical protein
MIEVSHELFRINPFNFFEKKRTVRPADESAGNPSEICVRQNEMSYFFHWAIVIRDEKETVLDLKLMKQ